MTENAVRKCKNENKQRGKWQKSRTLEYDRKNTQGKIC